jgi:4-hydroxybenzoate polyprenyltransferase
MPPVNVMRTPAGRLPVLSVAWLCFQEARPIVQGVFMLRLLSGWALTVGDPERGSLALLVAGAAAWSCVVMSIYLLNGVSDQQEDRINRSPRPIARGLLAGGTAERVAWVLAAGGVVGGFAAAGPLGLLALASLAVGWLYCVPSWRLKRRSLGTAASALTGIALTYYAGAVIAVAQSAGGSAGVVVRLPAVEVELLVFGSALSLWAALVGGTTKDLPDVAGDRAAGTRSWAVVWGQQRFRWTVSAIALLIGAGSVVAAIRLAPALLPVVAMLLTGAVAVAVLLLAPVSRARRPAHRRSPYRAFMATQYGAHLVLLASQFTAIVG